MFKTILVATDGSEHGRNAARVAGNIASRYGARLAVAHVVTDQRVPDELRRLAEVEHIVEEPKPDAPAFGRLSVKPNPEASEQRLAMLIGHKVLDQGMALARQEGAGDVTRLELAGDPADALLEAVAEEDADLVVIGSRGFGAIGRLVHGSVSSKVAQEASCPCLIVK